MLVELTLITYASPTRPTRRGCEDTISPVQHGAIMAPIVAVGKAVVEEQQVEKSAFPNIITP
jgi:hypothetical protein